MVPSARLIWLLAFAGFPAAVIEAVIPQARVAAVAIIVADCTRCRRRCLLRNRALAV